MMSSGSASPIIFKLKKSIFIFDKEEKHDSINNLG